MARIHAKFIMNKLQERQKALNLSENLTGLFAKSLSFWRMILPINEPVGKNKQTRKQCDELIKQTKDIVQSLNDQFNHYQQDDPYTTSSLSDRINPFDQR
jgi:non-homologous end joining protein Ku